MNCPFCGAPLEEGARFCSNCGAKITPAADVPGQGTPGADGQYQPQPPAGPAASYEAEPLPVTESPVWQALRGTLSSPIFLLLAVLLTCELAVTLINGLTAQSMAASAGSSLNSNSSSLLIGTLVGALPLLLFTAGVWSMWSSSRGKEPLKGPGAVRTASVIMVVLFGLALGILAIALVPILLAWSAGHLSADSTGIQGLTELFDGSFVLFAVILGLAFLILLLDLIYFAQLARLARTIRETDETGLLRGSVPGFLNFMHILMIIPLLGGVTVILASGRVKEFLAKQGLAANLGFMDILTTLLGAVLLIVLFIAVRTLKRNLKNAAA